MLLTWVLPTDNIHVFICVQLVSYSCFHNHHLCPRGEGVVVAAEVFFNRLGWRLGIFDVSSSFVKNRLLLFLRFRYYNIFILSWLFLLKLPFSFWFFVLRFDVLVISYTRYFRDCQNIMKLYKNESANIYQIVFDIVHIFVVVGYIYKYH